jgi:hypothetical protein
MDSALRMVGVSFQVRLEAKFSGFE